MFRNKSFDNKTPLLYLVATPIGNLQEMSNRALNVLKEMDVIAAEDTRNTFMLLSQYGIKKELFSLREHNELEASKHVIELLKSGKKVAYVSDAGYPGISDPGYLLVKTAIESGISVSTISGSSAFINALVASGLPTDHFYFYGFLSKKGNDAKKALEDMLEREETLIFYESPHHIEETIKLLHSVFGDRRCVIARELTKLNEEYIRGNLLELTELDLSGYNFNVLSTLNNSLFLSENNITSLTLSDNKFVDEDFQLITDILTKNPKIKKLNISKNTLTQKSCNILGVFLNKSTTIEDLNISSCGLTGENIALLVNSKGCLIFKNLILDNNNIGDIGLVSIGAFIKNSKQLEIFELKKIDIGYFL